MFLNSNSRYFLLRLSTLAFVILQIAIVPAPAAPPDLTASGTPNNTRTTNLGPIGVRGWVYHVNSGGRRADTSESRQILVSAVAAGSPAAGILAANEVILGADGTGVVATPFSYDARKALADAINDAEARNPATLSLLVWRPDQSTATVTLTLQHMGAYSATAPYNCPKSALILQQGLAAIMAGETTGRYSFATLSLIAANDPGDPANAARLARAQTEARARVPSAAVRTQMMSDERDTSSVWERGHTLIMLTEYYLATGDAEVIPGIEAYAVNIARNSSLFGTMGHIFAEKKPDGSDNGPMGGFYGSVNNAGMPCFLGLILARECGITHPSITPAIERMNIFYRGYIGKGAVPYGEHAPFWDGHENNGKSGLAAVCYKLQDDRVDEAKYYAKMATAASTERERGHTGAYFNYVWSPLGAAAGGEQAAASHFSRIRWMLDLNRRWDHGFDYDCLNGEGPNSGANNASYHEFRMSTAALLTYALPLRQLRITGKNHDPSRWLSSTDVAEAAAVDGYSAVPRSTNELIDDLGSWSPAVQRRAANQLATRTIDSATLTLLTNLANDPNGSSRVGACLTLGRINNSATADSRAATLAALLTDPENRVRFMAAEGMRYLPQTAKMSQLNTILAAAATTARPLFPFDEEDPLHFDHGRLAMLLFYSGTAYGPRGVIWNNLSGVDRNLLYPAMRAVAANPVGQARSTLSVAYQQLTAADVNALAGTLVESVRFRAPSDKMFSGGIRRSGMEVLEKYKIAEGVPLSIIFMVDDGRADAYNPALAVLQKYAGSSTTVLPDPDVIGFCQSLLSTSYAVAAQNVLNAIAADTNPAPLTPFKSIQSLTTDAATLNLPANQTILRVTASDLAEGDTIFTWRMVRGAGNVTFTPNGAAAAKDAAIQFDGLPGNYLFEVKMSDSRNLTELYGTVEVTLRNPDGTLPPNDPPTAHPQAIQAIPGSPAPITLTGTDPEGYSMVFSVTSPPAHGTLSGTAPDLFYTANATYLGPDSFTFQVMDSEGQVDSAIISINVTAAGVELYVHEPFDYAPGGLSGKGGTSEIGLDGTWHAQASAQVVADSLTYGSLPVLGGSIGNLNSGSNNYGGSRTVSTSALAANGMLDDGATLWFSVVVGYGSGGNVTNSRLGFAFANHRFSSGNNQYYILDEGSQAGSGLGLTLGRFNGVNGKVVATQFRDSTFGTSTTSGNVFGNIPSSIIGASQQRLVVGKITWGADSDTLELYEPDAELNIGPPTSVLTVNVDQSTFDTITWARGDVVTMDEIRFGNSLAAVTGVEGAPADTDPPLLLSIADDRGGETMQQGESVTYTLTFNEPMAEASISAADFENAGSSSILINSVIQFVPGVVTVNITPDTTGTLQFRVPQGAVLTDVAGNPLDTTAAITDDTIITVNPAMIDVPFVVGIPRIEAETTITDANLITGVITFQSSDNVPSGNIISQNPPGGTGIAQGSTVDLVVSDGAPYWTSNPIPGDNAIERITYSSSLWPMVTNHNGHSLTFDKTSGPGWLVVAADGALSGIPLGSGHHSFGVSFTDGISTPTEAVLLIHVISAFTAWAGEETTFTNDSNGDGLENGLAWLLGAIDLYQNARSLTPSASEANGDMVVTFRYLRSPKRGSALLRLQYSRDLGIADPWADHTIEIPSSSGTVGGVNFFITPDPENNDLDQVQAILPSDPEDRIFVRLSGELPPP